MKLQSTWPITLLLSIVPVLSTFAISVPPVQAAQVHVNLNSFETKGNFAAWALHVFAVPSNRNHPLSISRYHDVNGLQRYVFGQAVNIGLIAPTSTHTLGTRVQLTKMMAANGLVHLLHINTHGFTPYQFALENGWFEGTTSSTMLRRKDMFILQSHVKKFLASSSAPVTPYQIPPIPASGELNLATPPTTYAISANPALHIAQAYANTPGQNVPVQLNAVIYNPTSSNIVVTGTESTGGQNFSQEVWLQINELGTSSGNQTNQWQYPIEVNANGSFAYALHVPFPADTYEVQVAPPLTTAQTSLNYTFDTNEQSVSQPFRLTYNGQDSNQQLGLLTSVWANYTDPTIQALAKTITTGLTSPLAMAQSVYNWEGRNIGYNGKLLLHNGYGWSTTEETLTSKVGICVDYANVADALLRSLNIPTQMVVGYASDSSVQEVDNGNNGHAWNRSWINGQWVYFDPTWSRVYFLSSATALPGPQDLWGFQPQWFNPSPKIFDTTHHALGVQDQ